MSDSAEKHYKGFGTKAIHAGVFPDPSTGAIMTPIFQTSTYVQASPGDHKGYEYARTQNPTRDQLQANLAALENAEFGFCFATGMAATDTVMKMLSPGDEVLSTNDLYGGSYRLFTKVYEGFGMKFNFQPLNDWEALESHVTSATKMLWVETPTNPMVHIVDLEKAGQFAKKHGLILVVDNTFASPYNQNPLDHGAHIVMHSVTKYLGGHSDVVMGALLTNDENLAERIKFLQNTCGGTPGPQDCFLVLRGVKTLHLRMKAHGENGMAVAQYLDKHPKIAAVHYPGLPSHEGHDIAKRQMRTFGGMMSFELVDDSLETAFKLASSFEVFSLAESLGGVESLVGHPATMTHAAIPREQRLEAGVKDGLIRLSVGVEDIEDLIADLEQALGQI